MEITNRPRLISKRMDEYDEEYEEATNQVLAVLEEWGSESKFIWLRELHRITDIDKGLLRNILNELKKSKEVKDMHGTNNRIFFCLRKYYVKCRDVEFRFKGKEIMLRDGSTTYQFRTLPFGLSTALRGLRTSQVCQVNPTQSRDIRIYYYLHNWLIRAKSH